MSAAKHTPGPWVVGSTSHLLFGRPQGNGTEPIGFVYGPSFPERSEVGQRALADALLCAAAPELLECTHYLLGYAEGSGMAQAYPETVASIRAVIAKATGGAT